MTRPHQPKSAHPPKPAPKASTAPPGTVRLQRFLADAGVASRRDCEKWIEDGRVQVNGSTVTELPIFIDPKFDRVTADGRLIDPRAARSGRVYLILNKPDNTLTSTRDGGADGPDEGRDSRRTVLDLIDHPAKSRLFPVGRLDFHATGMVLLTNDGQLAQRLTHARFGITKTYRITVRGNLHEDAIESLTRRFCPTPQAMASMSLAANIPQSADQRGGRGSDDDVGLAPTEPLRIVSTGASGTTFDLVMRAGAGAGATATPPTTRSRPVVPVPASPGTESQTLSATKALASMLSRMGNHVKRIHRIAIGPLVMRYVTPGTARALRDEEVDLLRVAAGLIAPSSVPRKRPAARPTTRPGSRSGSRPNARAVGHSGPRGGSRTGARPDSRSGPSSDSRSNARPGTRPSIRPGARSSTRPSDSRDARPDARSGPRSSQHAGPRADARSDSRSGPRPDSRSGPRPTGDRRASQFPLADKPKAPRDSARSRSGVSGPGAKSTTRDTDSSRGRSPSQPKPGSFRAKSRPTDAPTQGRPNRGKPFGKKPSNASKRPPR